MMLHGNIFQEFTSCRQLISKLCVIFSILPRKNVQRARPAGRDVAGGMGSSATVWQSFGPRVMCIFGGSAGKRERQYWIGIIYHNFGMVTLRIPPFLELVIEPPPRPKDDLLQRIKERFEKAKDLVVRAFLGHRNKIYSI